MVRRALSLAVVLALVAPVPSTGAVALKCTSSVGPGIPPPALPATGIDGYHAAWYGQSGYMRLCPGDEATATVAYLNTGSLGWVAGRPGETAYLGTWGPEPGQDQPSSMGGDGTRGSPSTGWPAFNRPAVQPAAYVGPGQVAWFQFRVRAPQRPGTYRIGLRPLIEGTQWMEDYGVYWVVEVPDTSEGPPVTGQRQVPAGSFRLTSAVNVLTTAQGASALPSIAVGPESFVVVTNPRTLLLARSGAPIADMSTAAMLGSVIPPGSGPTDMRVMFDHRSQRFFITGAAGRRCSPPDCAATWLVAVSRSSAPRTLTDADWYFYGFDGSTENGVPTGQWGDFNVISVTDDMLILVGISIPADWQAYAKIWVFAKRPFLDGAPVRGPAKEFVRLRDPASGRLLQKTYPAVTFGDVNTVFFVSYSSVACSIAVAAVSGPAERAELQLQTAQAGGSCTGPVTAPQLGGGVPIDTMPRFESPPVYRNGRLWLVDSVLRQADGADVGALRLVELDVTRWPAAPTFVTDSIYMEPGVWYFNPALTVDEAHNVAIVANRSSAREYGSVWLTGRRAADPPGSFRVPVAIKHGEAHWNWTETSHEPPIRQRNMFSGWTGAAFDSFGGSAWVVGQSTRSACEWDLWVARTDFSVAGTTTGAAPALAPPVVPTRSCRESLP